ncbi:hypothetical protein HDU97_006999, partial [Phlyctochytrium planicorne]
MQSQVRARGPSSASKPLQDHLSNKAPTRASWSKARLGPPCGWALKFEQDSGIQPAHRGLRAGDSEIRHYGKNSRKGSMEIRQFGDSALRRVFKIAGRFGDSAHFRKYSSKRPFDQQDDSALLTGTQPKVSNGLRATWRFGVSASSKESDHGSENGDSKPRIPARAPTKVRAINPQQCKVKFEQEGLQVRASCCKTTSATRPPLRLLGAKLDWGPPVAGLSSSSKIPVSSQHTKVFEQAIRGSSTTGRTLEKRVWKQGDSVIWCFSKRAWKQEYSAIRRFGEFSRKRSSRMAIEHFSISARAPGKQGARNQPQQCNLKCEQEGLQVRASRCKTTSATRPPLRLLGAKLNWGPPVAGLSSSSKITVSCQHTGGLQAIRRSGTTGRTLEKRAWKRGLKKASMASRRAIRPFGTSARIQTKRARLREWRFNTSVFRRGLQE